MGNNKYYSDFLNLKTHFLNFAIFLTTSILHFFVRRNASQTSRIRESCVFLRKKRQIIRIISHLY